MNRIGVADYGMDVWYGGSFCLKKRLEDLKSIGIDGIECLKGADMSEAVENALIFHRMNMGFSTPEMSTPELTLKCASAFDCKYVWFTIASTRDIPFEVYCRRANAFVEAAEYYGVKAALHNHLGTRVENMDELDAFMKAVPGASLLLDIGHLQAAGGDSVEAVRKYHDRLAAVHFKDVYYTDRSKGLDEWWKHLRFCEIDKGNAGLDWEAVAKELLKFGYSGWVLIEDDTHLRDPLTDLAESAEKLKRYFGNKLKFS